MVVVPFEAVDDVDMLRDVVNGSGVGRALVLFLEGDRDVNNVFVFPSVAEDRITDGVFFDGDCELCPVDGFGCVWEAFCVVDPCS
jgi:hypothetical protein